MAINNWFGNVSKCLCSYLLSLLAALFLSGCQKYEAPIIKDKDNGQIAIDKFYDYSLETNQDWKLIILAENQDSLFRLEAVNKNKQTMYLLATKSDKAIDFQKFKQFISDKLELGKIVRETNGRFTFPNIINFYGNEDSEVAYHKNGKYVICRYIICRNYVYAQIREINKTELKATSDISNSFKLSVGRTGLGYTGFNWILIVCGILLILFIWSFIDQSYLYKRRQRIKIKIDAIADKIISNNNLPKNHRETLIICIYNFFGINQEYFKNEGNGIFYFILGAPLFLLFKGIGDALKLFTLFSYEFWLVPLFFLIFYAIAYLFARIIEGLFYYVSTKKKNSKFYILERELAPKILELSNISDNILYPANISTKNTGQLNSVPGSTTHPDKEIEITPSSKSSVRNNKQEPSAPNTTRSRQAENHGHPQTRGPLDDRLSRASSSEEKPLPTRQVDDRLSRASSSEDIKPGFISDEERLTGVLIQLNEKMHQSGLASTAASKVATVSDVNTLLSGRGSGSGIHPTSASGVSHAKGGSGSGGMPPSGGGGSDTIHDALPKGGGEGSGLISDLFD